MAHWRRVLEALILLVAGVALLVCCAIFSFQSVTRAGRGAEAQGEIVGFEKSTSRNARFYFPVITFTDVDGTRHRFESDLDANYTDYDVGDKVSVLYDPENPDNASIYSFLGLWKVPLLTGGLGAILTWGGAVFTRRRLFKGQASTTTDSAEMR